MSLCNKCTALKGVSLCTDSIVIGNVGAYNMNTDYVVYFRSLATNQIYSYPVTSDAQSDLTLTFSDGFNLAVNHFYELWVNKDGDSIESQDDLVIGTTTATCYTLYTTMVHDIYNNVNVNYAVQTLEVAE